MGDEVYGTIQNAFDQMLRDAARLPDGGKTFRMDLYAELSQLLDNPEYEAWVENNLTNVDTIKLVAGRFVAPDEVRILFEILEGKWDNS